MKVVFRTDASLQIGTGHVMRCLTLADALRANGAECEFICRDHVGNLIKHIRDKGYVTHALPLATEKGSQAIDSPQTAHAAWLGSSQDQDAADCAFFLTDLEPEWLIVDHYALDARWEFALKPYCRRLMVIDDLADRPHLCDLLLDQTFGRNEDDYRAWVPDSCQRLCGSQYALLRPEFAALRSSSLQRRAVPQLRRLLISMGGVDKDNATRQVLEALRVCPLPTDCLITVVMGVSAPGVTEINDLAQSMPWPTNVMVGVSDMAQLMADSDLAIGAAGATSWERCCLGLPTAMLVLADNQRYAASLLSGAQAVKMLYLGSRLSIELPLFIGEVATSSASLSLLSASSSSITDGMGCRRTTDWLFSMLL